MILTAADHELLVDELVACYADPLRFVMFAFPWSTDPSLQLIKLESPYRERFGCEYGPDVWACEFLDDLGDEVRARGFDGIHAVQPIQMAVASGHGIGKSTLTAWIVNWIMSTRPGSHGTVTANTNEQLSTKTWAAISNWAKKSITSHWWKISTGRGSMRMSHVEMPDDWFCSAQTCREENSESFAGQHAATATSFYIFDEASAIPDKISEVASGGLATGEPMWFKFGNPTRNSGDFADVFNGNISKRWNTRQIDSRDVAITNKVELAKWVEDYGIDSDFVKVRVRGIFPSHSIKQFISTADVDLAKRRQLRTEQYDFAPKILTCDPAWEGDDELVIGLRQGLYFTVLHTMPRNDNDVHVANILCNLEDQHNADAVFIDGGYGTGIVSVGKTLGRQWRLVWFGGASTDTGCLNKRAEMWKLMRDWLKDGGKIEDNDHELYRNLIQPETVPRMDGKIQLESKQDMKRRKLHSPNRADALALSFAYPVHKKSSMHRGHRDEQMRGHDPIAAFDRTQQSKQQQSRGYDPHNFFDRGR
ncbi:hypothetical protein [Methylomonas sp. AM2-LC]|uniref:hypothetical protein n=1 Tax=Methylomonas sp. AM2-LC TaxID=3153301 RepID=UPI0032659DF1